LASERSADAKNEIDFYADVGSGADFWEEGGWRTSASAREPLSAGYGATPRSREGGKSALKETAMTTDRYTKVVLTVIAGCLLWMCAMGTARPLMAEQEPAFDTASIAGRVQPVVIVGTGVMDAQGKVVVNFVRRSNGQVTDPTVPVKLPYSQETPLPVRLPYTMTSPLPAQLSYSAATPLPVAITGIKRALDWEPIRTQVEDAPLRRTPGVGGQH
jgi:hypothetical protein